MNAWAQRPGGCSDGEACPDDRALRNALMSLAPCLYRDIDNRIGSTQDFDCWYTRFAILMRMHLYIASYHFSCYQCMLAISACWQSHVRAFDFNCVLNACWQPVHVGNQCMLAISACFFINSLSCMLKHPILTKNGADEDGMIGLRTLAACDKPIAEYLA